GGPRPGGRPPQLGPRHEGSDDHRPRRRVGRSDDPSRLGVVGGAHEVRAVRDGAGDGHRRPLGDDEGRAGASRCRAGRSRMNPLENTGIPVEDQFRNWSELNVEPFDKLAVDPYTRTRVILMNGIEVESIIFSHQFARNTDNVEIKQALALSRRAEAHQQKVVNGLNPGDQTPLETTIGY